MKIISFNVNGIRAAIRKGFLEWLKKENPDILLMQEVKAQPQEIKEYLLNLNYYTYFNCPKKGYAGVATFTKLKPDKIIKGIGIEKFDSEGRVLTTEFKNFILLNLYFPHSRRDLKRLDFKLDFNKEILKYIEKLKETGKGIILGGDLNVAHKETDLANPKENKNNAGFTPRERFFIDEIIETGSIDTFREFNKESGNYTWWTYRFKARERNIGWRIDYFFITSDLKSKLKDAFVLSKVMGSDHCPVGIKLAF
ncbi:MAG: exodeoxyribonuclease III [Candidatus Aenigmarchaeota archaeon]|nr:exodeoxyribonuclease III [Candidatus Aenigmarchaeota archaeon]